MAVVQKPHLAILNPTANELDLKGLSVEERKKILQVLKKEQQFMKKEEPNLMQGYHMEGQLHKFTNLMKGWQYRWFVLEPEKGNLMYYLDKEKTRCRGSLPLSAAVVSPSEEDSMSFMISACNGDLYKLRANDAKERQHWINLIRAVSEYHGHTGVKPARPPPPKDTTSQVKRSSTISTSAPYQHSVNSIPKTKTVTYHTDHSPKVSAPSNPIQEELRNIKDALNSVVEYHSSAIEALENNSQSSEVISPLDEQALILKATSQATVNTLQQCFNILQQQAIDLQGSANTPGLPAGAFIEWFEPLKQRLDRSASITSDCSIETAIGSLSEFGNISAYSNDEVVDEHLTTDDQLEDMESHKSVILHLLSQLKLGMDLTRVVLPTFVLEKRSLLEMYADFMVHSNLFASIPNQVSAEERMFSVLEFYLTSFHVGRKNGVAKKPYNPILGEHFHCSFDVPKSNDRIHFVAEQVSHHPPISAFHAECPNQKISMAAHIWTKSKFYGMSIGVINVGDGVITLHDHNEEYICTFPNAYCRSILTVPWIELGGRTFIRCPQTGLDAVITFHTKPFYGGKANRVTCEIKMTSNSDEPSRILCQGEGYWDGSIVLNFPNSERPSKTIDVTNLESCKKRVRPLTMQSEYESRRLWDNVTKSLQTNELEKATEHKHKLEEKQRNEAKERSFSGTEWKTKIFHKHSDSWLLNPRLSTFTGYKKDI